MRLRRPRVRDVLSFVVSLLIALVGVVGIILFFEARDESRLDGARGEPGEPYDGEPALSPALEAELAKGNVVVLHRDARPPAGTRELTAGAGPRLRSIGLAVVLERERRLESPLVAIADERVQPAEGPEEIRNFVDFHLGS